MAEALAIVGLIRNAQGIRGEVVIEPLTDAPDAVFASGRRVFVGDAKGNSPDDQTLTVESARPFKGGMMVKFADVADRNAAELLRGRYVFSPFDELEPLGEDEVYLHELIGMKCSFLFGSSLRQRDRRLLELDAKSLLMTSLENAGPPQQGANGVARLSADAEPVVRTLLVHRETALRLTRSVLADDLDELSVARTLRVGDDDAVYGCLFPPNAAESNSYHRSCS